MKILILGASGFVGKSIYRELKNIYDVYGTYHSSNRKYEEDSRMFQLDIRDENQINDILNQIKPTIIISSLRGDFNKQLKIHEYAGRYLKSIEEGRLIFLSSVNVFDALDETPHYESDKPQSKSEYGKFKIECEKILQNELNDKAIILRLPFIWGRNSPRLNKILEEVHNQKLNLWSNLYTNHTSDMQIVNYIKMILSNNMKGIFHVGTNEEIDYEKFILKIVCRCGLKVQQVIKENFNNKCYMAVLSSRKDITENLYMTNDQLINSFIEK